MAPPSEPGGARAADAGNGSGATYGMADLVASSGVPAATIRHYLSLGLLPPPRRQSAHRFVYDRRHLEALSVIRSLRERRQLPLDVIRQMLPQLMADLDEAFPAAAWEQAVELHLGEAQDQGPAGRLLEAAIGAFTARGYADVTVDDLCAAVGLAKGSFYRYYPSKEELFFAVVETLGRRTVAALEQAAGAAGGFLDDSTAAEVVSSNLGAHLPIVLDLVARMAQRRPGYPRVGQRLIAEVAAAVTRLVALGGVPPAEVGMESGAVDGGPGKSRYEAGMIVLAAGMALAAQGVVDPGTGPDWWPEHRGRLEAGQPELDSPGQAS